MFLHFSITPSGILPFIPKFLELDIFNGKAWVSLAAFTVKRLKHGHLRSVQRKNNEDQLHFLMTELTGLSQADLDELDVEDSAKLSEAIFGFMRRYAQIAKEMAR